MVEMVKRGWMVATVEMVRDVGWKLWSGKKTVYLKICQVQKMLRTSVHFAWGFNTPTAWVRIKLCTGALYLNSSSYQNRSCLISYIIKLRWRCIRHRYMIYYDSILIWFIIYVECSCMGPDPVLSFERAMHAQLSNRFFKKYAAYGQIHWSLQTAAQVDTFGWR